ncbi:MAG: hypothetical protein R3F29_04135 [Planctomycetota bacterium]
MKLIAIILLASLSAFLFWSFSGIQRVEPPQVVDDSQESNTKPHAGVVEAEQRGRVAPELQVVVRDAATGLPIAGSMLIAPMSQDSQLLAGDAVCTSSADGVLSWGTTPDGDAFIVADGYLPHPLEASDVRSGVVRLRRGGSIDVRAHSVLGNPLAGVKVVLRGAHSADYSIPSTAAATGHPYSPDPEWIVQTDALGQAVLCGLPDKKFRLREWLEGHYPLTTQSAHREVTPPAEVTLALAEVWGCAAVVPDGLEVVKWDWRADGQLDTSVNVVSALEPNRVALERRFPGCICITAVPGKPEAPAVMHCTATMTNGTVWRVSWPLAKWSEITPVFLEQKVEILAREIKFRIEGPAGERLDVPIAAYDKVRDVTTEVEEARCMLVPGSYKVVPKVSSPWVRSRLESADFEVSAGMPPDDTVVLRMSEAMFRVEVALDVEPAGMDAVTRLRFLDEDLANATVLCRASEKRPCVMYLPRGRYRIRASGTHYAAPEQSVDVDADVELTLKLDKVVR